MSRNRLIAKYAALNTPDLPRRVYDEVTEFIHLWGIDDLPMMILSGRWTGTLTISNGGWHNDYDFNCSLLQLCRVDRTGLVTADMHKIERAVEQWRDWLTTPTDGDDDCGWGDETFDDGGYRPDTPEHMSTAEKYLVATESGEYTSAYDFDYKTGGARELFEDLLSHLRFTEVSEHETDNGATVHVYEAKLTPPTKDDDTDTEDSDVAENDEADDDEDATISFEELQQIFSESTESKSQSWLEFIENLRNGAFGELPEDYDGLCDRNEDEEDDEEDDEDRSHFLPY